MSSEPTGAGRAILEALAQMEARIMARLDAMGGTRGSGTVGTAVAPDADLDSEHGDDPIRKNPPFWIKDGGESHEGERPSTCPPAYLDSLADFYDWKAGKDDEKAALTDDDDERTKYKKYAGYARKDASRARGWAARLRAGWKPDW